MPQALGALEREYLAALLAFLESGTEQNLERAYGVARKAIANDLGVLDLAAMFRKALNEVLPHVPAAPLTEQILERSMNFFRESLSPFEMTLRGFRENNEKLRESCRQLTNAQMRLRYQNQELTLARQRYSEQFDFAPDGYLVTDLAGKIEEANVAASLLLGVDQGEVVGDSLSLYLQGNAPHAFATQLLKLQRGIVERLRDWETTITPVIGESFPATLSAGVIRDATGKPAGIRWLIRDITQFKRAEAERSDLLVRERVARAEAEASGRLAFLAEASTLLAASLDSESTLQNVAQLAAPLLADCCVIYILEEAGGIRTVPVAPAENAGNPGTTAMTECISGWIHRTLSRAPSGKAREGRPFLLTADDEAFRGAEQLGVCAALAAPLAARGKTLGAIALVSMQSQRRFGDADRGLLEDLARRCSYAVDNSRLYSEVILQRDKAEKASRVKDEFLAILSHELRNPLVPILGWARVFGTRSDTSEEVFAEGVRSLERNARNIQRLVDDCLELVRTSTRRIRLELRRMDLNSIAAASIEAVVPLAREKGLKLDIDLSDGPLWIVGDRTRLEQVVVNLLTNAVKYTPSGSVEIRSSRSEGHAELHVTDTGIGIAPDFIGKVFEPFRQATDAWLTSDSGLGIGLSIAREIVRLHSGWIWAESAGLSRGSTFSIAFPLAAEVSAPSIANSTDTRATTAARRCRILLVEDSDDVLYLMKQELEWTGHKVYAAMDGMTALEIAKRELPDIIISDIKMPRLDGYEFIQQLRALPHLSATPAIAMTGFGMERDAEQARSAGYSAHVVKPVDIAEMERLIQTLTGGSLPARRISPEESSYSA